MKCQHENFVCECRVNRLSEEEGGTVTGYSTNITMRCAACGLPFRFVGLSAGTHHSEPRVSTDGTELRAPIEPATHDKFAAVASYVFKPRKDDYS